MIEKKMKTTKIYTKIILGETLRNMPLKGSLRIDSRTSKIGTVRTAASRLKKDGFLFEVRDRGLIDECIVTRLK